eukprot:GHUV01024258.1.p1 GENE.GHUV01024258.1~~GHUV01024258.1.p1  ORF type:complete len:145 (+),score=40.68 GHUV01024258.1:755-1189(+)
MRYRSCCVVSCLALPGGQLATGRACYSVLNPHRLPCFMLQFINGSAECTQHLPINTGSMVIDTPTFQGVMEVHFRGLPTTKKHVFDGKKRCFQVHVQGRFKRSVAADALMIGQEFVRPADNPWLAEMLLTTAAKAFSSSTKVRS